MLNAVGKIQHQLTQMMIFTPVLVLILKRIPLSSNSGIEFLKYDPSVKLNNFRMSSNEVYYIKKYKKIF